MNVGRISRSSEEKEFAFGDREFHFLARLVNEKTGIVLSDHKRDMVYSRLARRLRALELKDFAEYCALVKSDHGHEEMGNLVNAITTNLTHFFREEHHFDHLQEQVAALAASSSSRRLRIWSAGCSSGMEPYSIAMTLKAEPALAGWDVRILATDIDTNMLDAGANGKYPIAEFEHVPARYRSKISVTKDHMQMPDELKEMIAFKHLNLLESWPMKGPFDVVFCRNVVIYFDKPTQAKLFDRIADLMQPDSWLYIGHSENIVKICNRFELCGRTIYRKVA